MQTPTWIYHPTQAPRIVDACAVAQYQQQGWADTPAAFQHPPAKPTRKGKGKA